MRKLTTTIALTSLIAASVFSPASAQETSSAVETSTPASASSVAAEPEASTTVEATSEPQTTAPSASSDAEFKPRTNSSAPATLSTIVANPPAPAEQEFNDAKWRGMLAKKYAQHKDGQGRARVMEFSASSPSMNNRSIPLVVIRAKDANRPTVYLLNGAGGGEQSIGWVYHPKVVKFYLDRNVNVVIPMRGAFSYYVDWAEDQDGTTYNKGPQRWETFLTQELPDAIERHDLIQANGKRGIIGMSMSATSSLLLAARNPGFYQSVGSYSGCAATTKLIPSLFTQFTLERDGVNPAWVFGPEGSDRAKEHDALIQAEGLKGSEVYISNASGLASANESFSNWLNKKAEDGSSDALQTSSTLTIEGGLIEAATNACTHDFKAKLDQKGIQADYKFRNTGVHTWRYWIMDATDSWPTIARGLGIEHEYSKEDAASAEKEASSGSSAGSQGLNSTDME